MKKQFTLIPLVLGVLPMLAFAHPQGHADSLISGFTHPWLGTDHLLAMLAVGMLAAAQTQIKTQFSFILMFLVSLLAGVYITTPEQLLPSAEYLVSLSVGLLGISLLLSQKLPRAAVAAIIIASGLLHGVVHGAEIPNNTQSTSFVVGMLIASALLHLGGFMWLKWGIRRALPYFQKVSAYGLALSSVYLMLSF